MSGLLASIPSGTHIPVTLDQDIPIDRNRFGEAFPAHVTRDVVVNGKVAVPQGAPAEVKLMPSEEQANSATLQLSKLEVGGHMREVSTSSARADADEKLGTGKKTAIGAAAGAVIGAVTGRRGHQGRRRGRRWRPGLGFSQSLRLKWPTTPTSSSSCRRTWVRGRR